MKRLIVSVALGFATSAAIGLTNEYVPYSGFRVRVVDALTVPGALIAGLVYPQGVHTGRGAPTFGLWAMAANIVVYVGFWYVCLRIVGIRRQRRSRFATDPQARTWRRRSWRCSARRIPMRASSRRAARWICIDVARPRVPAG